MKKSITSRQRASSVKLHLAPALREALSRSYKEVGGAPYELFRPPARS
ncbi:MAG: hypothetical protein RR091_03415 [Cloacibacillus sp.]